MTTFDFDTRSDDVVYARDLAVGATYRLDDSRASVTVLARGCGGVQLRWSDDGATYWVHPASEWPINGYELHYAAR